MADNVAITSGTGTTIAADDIGGGVYAQRVKPVWGPDGTGTDVDTTTPLPTSNPDVTASGNITTQNLVPAGAATAGSAVEISMAGAAALTVQVTGTYTGALSVQGTLDGTNWRTLGQSQIIDFTSGGGGAAATIGSGNTNIYLVPGLIGFLKVRVTGLAAMTGTAVVTLRASAQSTVGIAPSSATTLGVVSVGVPTVVPAALASSGGANTHHHAISAASTNATSVKASSGSIAAITVTNINAAARFFKLYNKSTAPTVGTDTPILTALIPPGGSYSMAFGIPIRFVSGIAYALTTGITDADTGAVSASEHSVHIAYV